MNRSCMTTTINNCCLDCKIMDVNKGNNELNLIDTEVKLPIYSPEGKVIVESPRVDKADSHLHALGAHHTDMAPILP